MRQPRLFVSLAVVALLYILPVSEAVFVLHTSGNSQSFDCPTVTLSGSAKQWNTLISRDGAGMSTTTLPPTTTTTFENPGVSSTCHPISDPVVLTARSGAIMSPGFDKGEQYPSNLACGWLIRGPPGSKIRIEFKALLIEPNLLCGTCGYDELIIYDGTSMSPTILGGPYCGDEVPPPLESNTNEVFVAFSTDHSVSRAGFMFQYSAVGGLVVQIPTSPTTSTSTTPTTEAIDPATLFSWCRMLSPITLDPPEQDYRLFVRLMAISSTRGQNFAMPGLAFNVVDENNFDFFLMRFVDSYCNHVTESCPQRCIQYGYVENGDISMVLADQADCSRSNHIAAHEYRVRIHVEGTQAAFSVNEHSYLTVTSHFPLRSRCGVVVPSGYENEIRYRSAQITEI